MENEARQPTFEWRPMLHRDVSWIRTCAVTTALDGLGTLAGVGGGNQVTRSRVTKGSKSDEPVARREGSRRSKYALVTSAK